MFTSKILGLCLLLILTALPLAHAQNKIFESTPEKIDTLELFTSEGCSSCPPADDWLNRLEKSEGLWTRWIPMVFHVDYWDYLGWKDPWASSEFSNRQRAYAAVWNSQSVYTPGMVLNGKEWGDWRRTKLVPVSSGRDKPGVLKAVVSDAGKIELEFYGPESGKRGESLLAHAVILGFDQVSNVRSGENSGRKLLHQFNVLKHVQAPMKLSNEIQTVNLDLPNLSNDDGARKAVVFWVSSGENPTPIQAAGGQW